MIGWYYKTFQSSFALNKFIFGPFRSRMRAPHPYRGSPTGDVWMNIPQGHALEKQLTDILKRWISNIATFGKVRENSTGKKYGGKIRGKSKGKSHVTSGVIISGQACAMIRYSGSSTWILHKYGLNCAHILLVILTGYHLHCFMGKNCWSTHYDHSTPFY